MTGRTAGQDPIVLPRPLKFHAFISRAVQVVGRENVTVRSSVGLDLGRHLNKVLEVNTDAASRASRPSPSSTGRVEEFGFDFICSFIIGLREMHHIVCLVFDRKNKESRRRALALIRTLITETAAKGWGEYRAHLALMDQIAATYDFNDNAQMKMNETLKNALDPKGVLAPGKNGI